MVSPRPVTLPVLFSALLGGCALGGVLRTPAPLVMIDEGDPQGHLEIHRMHHRMAIEAHEAAVRAHQEMLPPPPIP
jgi:hypothetical protein